MDNVVVVVVDVQRDFLDANSSPGVGSWAKAFCVPGVERLLAYARDRGWQIVHVGTKHTDCDTLPLHHRKKGIDLYCQEDTDGCDFIVVPAPHDPILFKHWYSAFDADLERYLGDGQTIVWAGVASDCCIQQSAFEADRRGLLSIVPYQAVSASHRPAFVGSLVSLAKSACDVVDLDEMLGGAGVEAAALEVQDIEARAHKWYDEQRSRLGDEKGLALGAALERLR